MEKIKNLIKVDQNSLKSYFYEASKSSDFRALTSMLKLSDDELAKHTSLLKDSSIEYHNCLNCKGYDTCKNNLKGYCYLPREVNNTLEFSYVPCKYTKKILEDGKYSKNIQLFEVSENLKNAKMKNIYTNDKARIEVLKTLDSYYDNYFKTKDKGIYLYGNFGSGKTYLIAALFNELAKKEVKSAIIYFPEFLRNLKSSFNANNDEPTMESKFDYIRRIPLLLIDDIGAENVTAWGRDEILGSILQYRMDNNLATFFTSNLSIVELEEHLSIAGARIDKVKARRIIERIKYLTNEVKLVGLNRR